jgi:hypothetical protein
VEEAVVGKLRQGGELAREEWDFGEKRGRRQRTLLTGNNQCNFAMLVFLQNALLKYFPLISVQFINVNHVYWIVVGANSMSLVADDDKRRRHICEQSNTHECTRLVHWWVVEVNLEVGVVRDSGLRRNDK